MTTTKTNPLSVAPMMRRTDRHFRYFLRLLTRHTLLYTEMYHTREVLDSDGAQRIAFSECENPLVLQIGGDDPMQMAECARIAQGRGYDEINLNIGCPSERVQSGNFGVCLMGQPEVVARCVEAMQRAVDIPVTVKHRIGFDDTDSYEDMARFVRIVSEAGCRRFTVHARKAWLQGLSPKENRNVPPLRYEDVYRLKEEFPELFVEINGGIETLDEVEEHLEHVDAVMIGRAAYDTPFLFAEADRRIYGDDSAAASDVPDRHEAVELMLPYVERRLAAGDKLSYITGHLLNLFAYQPGARAWRRHISEHSHKDDAGVEVLTDALALVPRD
ncbi:MAG: tRNA dihydrouridine(20/20a) synthase DusA [Persicimonas sp.]